MEEKVITVSRRTVAFGLATLGAAGLLGHAVWQRLRPEPTFEPFVGVPGFRRTQGGAVSTGVDVFAGLDSGSGLPRPAPLHGAALCAALFEGARPGPVQVASFSDYYCTYCRVLTQILQRLEAEGRISVAWHELPLLGPGSHIAARAAMAAEAQGQYARFHARLMRAQFQPTAPYLAELAASAGLDVPRFEQYLQSDAVTARLARSAQVARTFRFPGTPALVVGQTVIVGAISEADLLRLIEIEARGGGACG